MPANRRNRVIEKKIFFYRILVDDRPVQNDVDFDFPGTIAVIGALPYDENGRYQPDEEDSIISCFVDTPNRLRFGKIRRSNLPPIVDGPQLTALRIPPHGGLFECSHLVYFGHGVIGAEFNNYAPRLTSKLGPYLRTKADIDQKIDIVSIVRGSPAEALQRFQAIHSITVKVATSEADHLNEAGAGLISRIATLGREANIETVDFTLGTERGRLGVIPQDVGNALLNLVRMPDVRESVEKLKATGYIQGRPTLEAIDLLEDDLVVSKQFLREHLQSKTLNSRDAYRKITEAFDEIQPGLNFL